MLVNELEEVEAGEYEYPNEVYKVPIKAYFFYHFVVATFFVSAVYNIDQYQNVENNTAGNVCTMETGDGEEKVEELVGRLHSSKRVGTNELMNTYIMVIEETGE